MPTIDAVTVLNEVSRQMQDEDNTRYPQETTLLGYLNDGQREAATISPKVNPKTAAVLLVTGIQQELPVDGIRLINPLWNLGAAGATIGATINKITPDVMYRRLPTWTTTAANGVVKAVIYDDKNDLRHFMVWPPQPATPHYINIQYSALPELIEYIQLGITITIDDCWFNALVNYCVYRCYAENSEIGDDARAKTAYQMFLGELGIVGTEEPKPKDK